MFTIPCQQTVPKAILKGLIMLAASVFYCGAALADSSNEGHANGTGAAASFHHPSGVAVDTAGNVYVADSVNNMIRKISSAGVVTTLAGSGKIDYIDGTGTAASFYDPSSLALDSMANVYVSDLSNSLIRKITSAGVVTTVARSGKVRDANGSEFNTGLNMPSNLAVDAMGNIYFAELGSTVIHKISSAGEITTLASSGMDQGGTATRFFPSFGVAVDIAGNVYVDDTINHLIRKITPAGVATTLAGGGNEGHTNGTGAAASFKFPSNLAVDTQGNVYVSDAGNNLIRKITSTGVVTTLAGSGESGNVDGIGVAASFDVPSGLAVDTTGNVYVSDVRNNLIRKITSAGVVTTLAGKR